MVQPEVLRYAAFTRDGEGGNPAGIVLNADWLTERQMQAIAAAIKYSETAFVSADGVEPHRLRVRYFSPRSEVAFCGHATVATAVALAERDGPGTVQLSTMAGPVTVTTSAGAHGLTATLTSPPASSAAADVEATARALQAMGWRQDDLDPTYPVHVAFAGNYHLVIGVRDEATLASMHYDFDQLDALMAEQGWTSVNAFWAQSPARFEARNAFPPGGVVEDPATGAAAAAFGGYLRSIGQLAPPAQFTVLQGHHMGSPSELTVRIDHGSDSVQVSGAATRLAVSPYGDLDVL